MPVTGFRGEGAPEPAEAMPDTPPSRPGEERSEEQTRWATLQEIFAEASDLPRDQQTAFVSRACPNDSDLCAEILSLLRWHGDKVELLDSTAFHLCPAELDEALPSGLTGKKIGKYRVIRKLNSGGMGTVYEAERDDGEFEQVVALKVISSFVPTEDLLRRFHAERQILARLHHPHIAQLLDGGTTPDGQPYLIMEYIEGTDICSYATAHLLNVTARLRIFLQVCSAVQAAHQALIIHCDLKPGNILVTSNGFPKLLDFGVSSVLAGSPPGRPDGTEERRSPVSGDAMISSSRGALTPSYASPEQLDGGFVTTASDVYSLGVLLCVLLSGLPPFAARGGRAAIAPSALLKSGEARNKIEALAHARGTTPHGLIRQLQGDLDAIVLRALAEAPTDRYSSVEQMSSDVRAYLDLQPIASLARSRSYRYRKFFQRNRLSVLAAIGLLVAMLVGAAGIVWQARAAERERARAVRRFNDVRQIAYSVLFELSAAIGSLPGSTGAQALLAKRANAFLSGMAQDATDDPGFMRELAASYRKLGAMQGLPLTPNIGDSKGAVQSFRSAVYWGERARERDPGNTEGRNELAKAYDYLALTVEDEGEQVPLRQKAIDIEEALLRDHPERDDFRNALSIDYQHASTPLRDAGHPDAAMAVLKRSLQLSDRLVRLHPDNSDYKSTLSFTCKKMGGLLIKQQRWDEALQAYLRSLALDEERYRGSSMDIRKEYDATFAYDDIGYIYWHRGDPDRGLPWYAKSLTIRKAALAQDPTNKRTEGGVATVESYMGQLTAEKKEWSQALQFETEANAIRERLANQSSSGITQQVDLFETELKLAQTYGGWARESAPRNKVQIRLADEWRDRAQHLGNELIEGKKIGKGQARAIQEELDQMLSSKELRF